MSIPANILSIQDTIRMVVDVVADNGNVEFNLGPKADGTLAEFEKERLTAMGGWLKTNGESIYGAEKSPVGVLPAGRVTHKPKSKTLYYHVYDWPEDGVIQLPGIHNDIQSAKILANDKSVVVSKPTPGVIRMEAPPEPIDANVTVIAIQYQGDLKAEKYVPRVQADEDGDL